jgi:hypothetical protein
METIKQKTKKTLKKIGATKTQLTGKRKQAIEKAIAFWDKHAVDMSDFKFDREEANAR